MIPMLRTLFLVVLGQLVAALSDCIPLSQQLVRSLFVPRMMLMLAVTWLRRMHLENCPLSVGNSRVLVVLRYRIRSTCFWFRLGDSLIVPGVDVLAPCDHLAGACVCGTAAIVDDVVGSSATEGPLPRLERTSHTRPPTGLVRSVVYNEWAKSYQLVFTVFHPARSVSCSLARTIPFTGAACLSSSQVLAFGQAAVRLERSPDQLKEQNLTRRKSSFVFVGSVLFSLSVYCVEWLVVGVLLFWFSLADRSFVFWFTVFHRGFCMWWFLCFRSGTDCAFAEV